MKHLKFLLAFAFMALLNINPAWGATWTRVTTVSDLTEGGTFIIGYEDNYTNNPGVIVPMQSSGNGISTSASGYLYSGTTKGSSGAGTIDMSNPGSTTDYEITISESSTSGKILVKVGDYYIGQNSGENKLRFYSEESAKTRYTPTYANNVWKLTCESQYTVSKKQTTYYVQYNKTSGSERFAGYSGGQQYIVIFKKSAGSTKTTEKIEVKTEPTKTDYKVGEKFDPTGLVITKTYNDKSTEDVSYANNASAFTFSPTTTTDLQTSNTSVTITVDGQTTTQSINVASLSSIAVTTAPKTSYTTCETLVVSDWVVTGTYSDASTADVTSACTFSKANGASLLTTDTKVTVTHTATSKTCEKAITVSQGARDTFVDHIQGNADQYGDCNGYTIPSCGDATKGADCAGEHYKFIGWSSTTISTGAQTEPAGLLKAGDTHDATGATYYAVWAKEE